MQIKSSNLSPFILRGDGLAVRRKLPYVYAAPEQDTGPPPPLAPPAWLEMRAFQGRPSDKAPPREEATRAMPHAQQQQQQQVAVQQGGQQSGAGWLPVVEGAAKGAMEGEEEGAAVEAESQAQAKDEQAGVVVGAADGAAGQVKQHQHHVRAGPGGAGPHHESHLSEYKTVKARGRMEVMAQVRSPGRLSRLVKNVLAWYVSF